MNKKIILLLLAIVLIFGATSAVSAADISVSDVASNDIGVDAVSAVDVSDSTDIVSDISVSAVEVDTNVGNDEVSNNISFTQKNSSSDITKVSASNSFASIQKLVDNAKAGSTIKLSGTYVGNGTPIYINKALTIDGNGATLDGNGLSRILYVTGSNCVIKNINFIDGKDSNGGAIYWNGTNGKLTSCTFDDCYASSEGGSIYWSGSNGSVTKVKFLNSFTSNNGGAVYWSGSNGVLATSTFTNSSSTISGGAISWNGVKGTVYGCTFENSKTSDGSGGDISWNSADGTLYNCTFLNSHAGRSAGSIYWNGVNANIYDSYFINSSATGGTNALHGSGGAIYLLKENGKITNCTFTACYASTNRNTGRGGAIALYDNAHKTTITDCIFNDCTTVEGGAIYGTSNSTKIISSDFNNCSASNAAGAIYLLGSINLIDDCTFDNCTSGSVGGAISYASDNSILNNSHFEDCSAVFGGAVYCAGSSIYLDNSEFINCNVNGSPMAISGSVSWAGDNGKLTNSKFINSTASSSSDDATVYGGAVSWYGNNGKLADCTFTNSKIVVNDNANSYGGAIYWTGTNGELIDCTFTNSSNKEGGDNSYGGAVCWNNTNFVIDNSTFLDSFAEYGHAIYAEDTTIYNSTFYVNDDENESDMVYETDIDLLISQNDKFLYSKYITILSGDDMVKDVTNKSSFKVKLTDRDGNPIVGNVTFTFNGETFNVTTDDEGICILKNTSVLAAGNYSIEAIFYAEGKYYESNKLSAILTVNKVDSNLILFDNDGYYGKDVNLTVKIGVPDVDVEGPVIFYVDGVNVGNATVVNGYAIYTYCPDKTGNLIIKAVYEGSDIYTSSNDSAKLVIGKLDTSISVDPVTGSYKSSVTLTARVSSDVTVTDGQVSFYVDDVKVGSATVVNGVATCTFTPNKAGELNVKVFYSNSSYFKDSDSSNTINIDKANATLSLSQSGSYYKSTAVKAKLVNSDGTPLANEKISLTINGQIVNITTDSNGVATYNVPLAPGTYSISAKASGPNVVSNSVTGKVTIKKSTGVTITPTKLTTTYNSGKYFQVKVTKGSTPVVGAKIYLKIYTGKKYKKVTITTNANGIAKYSASKLALGKHKVIVGSAESTKYMTATAKTSYITIKKAPTTVSAPKVTNKYKKSAYFKVTVKNKATGKVVSGLKIKVKVYTGKKYKTYTIKTNSKGVAQLNTKSLSKGTHKVVLSSGNKYYTISKSGNLIVIK